MRGGRTSGWRALRAAIAVAVLYALALQTVIGAALAADFAGPAHTLCLQASDQPADGSGAPAAPPHHMPCCTAVHMQHHAPVPLAPHATIVWPRRRSEALSWRPEVVAIPRAPPRALPSARGPPTV